jgi:hypothetical protein
MAQVLISKVVSDLGRSRRAKMKMKKINTSVAVHVLIRNTYKEESVKQFLIIIDIGLWVIAV